MALLDADQLSRMGFAKVGRNVRISDKASFYGASRISIGDNSRIDDFCVLSAGEGGIELGSFVHIAPFCSLMGAGRIVLKDFSGLSSRVSIYSSSDDYSGRAMTNPTVPVDYTGVVHADVVFEPHVIVGAGSVVLPGVRLAKGVAVGALSLVKDSCNAFGIYSGQPARWVKDRRRDLLSLEVELRSKMPLRD